MDYLHENITTLATDFLIKKTRGYGGKIDYEKQAVALINMIQAEKISEIFSFHDSNLSSSATEYSAKLNCLLSNIDERSISWATWHKKQVFTSVITNLLRRMASEVEASTSAAESWATKQKIFDLEAQVEFGKPANAITFWDKLNTRINLPYLILLCLSAVLIAGLTLIGLSAEMTVNVEFNVGEILGGLLVGTGVAAAGISYAARDQTSKNERQDR